MSVPSPADDISDIIVPGSSINNKSDTDDAVQPLSSTSSISATKTKTVAKTTTTKTTRNRWTGRLVKQVVLPIGMYLLVHAMSHIWNISVTHFYQSRLLPNAYFIYYRYKTPILPFPRKKKLNQDNIEMKRAIPFSPLVHHHSVGREETESCCGPMR